jgi:uncharacterized protein (TIGR02246 family)
MISTHRKATVSIFLLLSLSSARLTAQTQPRTAEADSSAIKQVVAGYSEAFNHHDAHATANLFAEDADFTNLRGVNRHGRQEIEQIFVTLYAGILRNAHRTDTVKNVRFLTPEIAVMDDLWEINGSTAADGSENPVRKGIFDWVLTKVKGQWVITAFHEAEFPK